MPDIVYVEVTGLAELEKNLNELSEKLAKTALRTGSRRASAIVQKDAQGRAPVDTGKLRTGIIITSRVFGEGVKGSTISTWIGLRTKPKERSAFYGRFIEFGWRVGAKITAAKAFRRNVSDEARGGRKIEGRPFLAPAFEAKKFEMLEAFKREVSAAIERIHVKLVRVD